MAFVSHLYPKHSLILHTRHLYSAAPQSDLNVIYWQREVELFYFLSNSRREKKKIFVVFNKIYYAYICMLHIPCTSVVIRAVIFCFLLCSAWFSSYLPQYCSSVTPHALPDFFFLLTSAIQRDVVFLSLPSPTCHIFAIDTLHLNCIICLLTKPLKVQILRLSVKREARKNNFHSDWSVVVLALFMKKVRKPSYEFSALLLDVSS